MKVILILLFLIGCGEYPRYEITTMSCINEADKPKIALLAKELVSGATKNGMGGDYEDVDDTIEEAMRQSTRLYSKKCPALKIRESRDNVEYIPMQDFTENQLSEYNKLIGIKK